ncbi:hypothetical protein PQX77_010419 [Marasmius sp. AFHP31]|nr:hypothetical protein PQX77_010419 [Marasmius sp. AFHP31]
MSSSSPTDSSSPPSFIYPIKSLLSGIQPHRRSQGSKSPSPNQTPELTRSATLGLSSPAPGADTKDAAIAQSAPSAHQSTRSMSAGSKFPVRARRSRSVATFGLDETPLSGQTSPSNATRKASDPKSTPNFRHFPAGDEIPTSPRSFTQQSNSSPSSGVASPSEKSDSPFFASDLFTVDLSAPQSPDEYHYDSRHPPPLPLVAGQAFSSTSSSLLPHNEPSPQYERPWELGIVHLPTISSSRASSRSSKVDSRGRDKGRSEHSGQQSNASSSEVSNYYTPEEGESRERLDDPERPPSSQSSSSLASVTPIATVRFRHHLDEHGNHVITGREGELTACEDEPIRTPGAVQGFGVLIAVQELEDRLLVRQVSENSTEILGLSPQYLFSLECFTDTLPDSQAALLWDNIQFLSDPNPNPMNSSSESDDSERDAPHVFLLSGFGAPSTGRPNETTAAPHDPWGAQSGRRRWTCWVAMHRPQPSPYSEAPANPKNDLIIMEFELEVDPLNPLYPPPGANVPAASTTSEFSGVGSPESTRSGSSSSDSASGSSSSGGGSSTDTPGNSTDGSSTTLVSADIDLSDSISASSESSPIPDSAISPPSLPETRSDDTIVPNAPLGPLEAQSGRRVQKVSTLDGLDGDDDWVPSTEEILESTTSRSKPLLALERLRRLSKMPGPTDPKSPPGYGQTPMKRRAQRRSLLGGDANANVAGGVGMMDVFAVMAQINDQLGAAPDLDTFLKIVVGLIKDLTQFHRVLVYQFDEMWNGQTVAELVDWSQTHDLYMGLHFPASDIPAQARELYKLNKVRILYDRDQTTARLVVRSKADLDLPLNMTHCYLRAMSPIHVKYLGNMGVRASMSVSIMAFGTLWGLVACHSYGPHGMRVSFPVRQMLRLLSQSISRNIERLSYAQRLHTRKLINTMSSDNHPTGYIVSNADDLLGLFDADFGILVIGDGAKILGPNEHGQEILIMSQYLRMKEYNSIQVSQAVTADFPDLNLSTGLEVVAGLLYVPLSSGGRDFIAFLRRGQPRHVHWAGKPYKQGTRGNGALEPRKSFKIWSERLAGRSRAWTDEQLETAGVLALVYGKFIEVWRQKENALATTKLTNLLLSNASHEVRTPLNHIINYLEMALNGPLDGETRDNLSHSYTASKSLLFTINDLLDLTRLESGNETSFNEPFDLRCAIEDATYLYSKEAKRLGLDFQVQTENVPETVVGDPRKIKTVVQNLTANALKYTQRGTISVRCTTYSEPDGLRATNSTAVEIVVADTGCGIPPTKLESIFREFEQVESSEPKTSSEPGVGLGLAVVARIVEQLGGQLRVESKVAEGSRFSFLIPLSLTVDEKAGSVASRSSSSFSSSLRSRVSSEKSGEHEIDSLVEALSSSHMSKASSKANSKANSPSASTTALESSDPSPKPASEHGSFDVTDSNVPVRAVRVGAGEVEPPGMPRPFPDSPGVSRSRSIAGGHASPRHSVDTRPNIPRRHSSKEGASKTEAKGVPPTLPKAEKTKLRVLVVEDNDINRTILAKRLRMDGHTVVNTTNGQEGLDQVKSDQEFDAILMDINMPILDGYEASERIRLVEKALEGGSALPSPLLKTIRLSRQLNGRIPIFAVSASLFEDQRGRLSDAGMDGWILKPIDFKRMNKILTGVVDLEQRERDRYCPGYNWEFGGWLAVEAREAHSRETSTSSEVGDVPNPSS